MKLRRVVALALLGAGLLAGFTGQAKAALSPQRDDGALPHSSTATDFLEAHQYVISGARVAGAISARQTMTAWQVTRGTWQGQALDGLSLVLVETQPDDGRALPTTNCYISHLATPAQRMALLSAYAATQPSGKPVEPAAWRVEPAVIRLEIQSHSVVVHLGTIA